MAAERKNMLANRIRGALVAAILSTTALAPQAFAETAAATPAATAEAVPVDADTDRMDGAWNDLLETEGQLVGAPQFAALNSLAFQAAVVRVCEGHALDSEAFGKAIADILVSGDKVLDEAQAEERKTAILVAFGARYGLFLAEGHGDKKDFCDAGADLKTADVEGPVVLK